MHIPINILIVEDDMELRRFYKKILISEGFRVVAAQNGQEALDIFKNSWKGIDLIQWIT